MSFGISGLSAAPFVSLYGRDDAELAALGVRPYVADARPGFPCRITLEDAAPGERVLLLNYLHQPADSPYRSAHAIFVREGATHSARFVDTVPPALRTRMLSVRAFDAAGMLTDADLVDGAQLETLIDRLFADDRAVHLHVHYAKRGCYAARIDRGGA